MVVIAAPGKCFTLKSELRFAILKNLQDFEPCPYHFDADSIPRYDGYSMCPHLWLNGDDMLIKKETLDEDSRGIYVRQMKS
jgi:hypothetical protein